MTTAAFILFVFCAFTALMTAIGTVASRLPLRSAMSLLCHVISLAGLYLTLSAHLLAAIQLLVYAGAIVVLFVFVIMLIGPQSEVGESPRGFLTRVAALMAVLVFTLGIAFTLVDRAAEWVSTGHEFGTVHAVGLSLYRGAVVPFELISITLTTAIIGAIAVARRASKKEVEASKEARQATIDAQAEAESNVERARAA